MAVSDVSGFLDAITGLVGMYGEDPLITGLVPALMVGLLMASALSRVWE